MSETTFTPGPWRIDDAKDPGCASILAADGDLVVAGEYDGWMVPFGCREEGAANAHLIAAAPELYEVLSEAMERGGVIQMCLYGKALAALAKARGEV